jgi:hypothetical protein
MSMGNDIILLEQVRVASPCSADWDEMQGDDRVRFCEQCRLNVYNLAGMEVRDAAALVRETEGRLCVRFYARDDGTMLVEDCPVGFRAVRRHLLKRLAILVGGLAALFSWESRWRHWLLRSQAYLAAGAPSEPTMGLFAGPSDPGEAPMIGN